MPDDRVRRVLDRNKLEILTGKVKFLEEQWRRHKMLCAACGLHEDTAAKGFDDGWEIAKSLARAAAALVRYTQGPAAAGAQDNGRLF